MNFGSGNFSFGSGKGGFGSGIIDFGSGNIDFGSGFKIQMADELPIHLPFAYI